MCLRAIIRIAAKIYPLTNRALKVPVRTWVSALLPLLLLSCTHTEKLNLSRLKVPAGFHIAVFADAPHARQMVFSPSGVLLVTDMSDGTVLGFPDPEHRGHAERTVTVLSDLNAPHGITFHNGKLYVAEINAVRRYDWDESRLQASNGSKIADLPGSGGFGWTYCYGNRVPDRSQSKDYDCSKTIAPKIEMQAHSAPLGLVFYDGNMFPAEYRGSLFVTFHGSWNRSVPTGYKVARIKFNSKGEPEGPPEDFISGWLRPGETKKGVWMGRPV